MAFDELLARVDRYYSAKLAEHGPTARGVDWNSAESQAHRFEQVLKVCDLAQPFTLNDYGCGYGALVDDLIARGLTFEYRGFDISASMIAAAQNRHTGLACCAFFVEPSRLEPADYTVASGVFNVKQQASDDEWTAYLLHTLGQIDALSRRGFAFNALTKYSDPGRMRQDLYYADPLFLFDYCMRTFSRRVALLHDYPLYEFTLLVRK